MERRRFPRQGIGWRGRCILGDDPWAIWIECRAIDISLIGLGIEVFGPVPTDVLGRSLTVEVSPPTKPSVGLKLSGPVRHRRPGRHGSVHVGMEISDVSLTEGSATRAVERFETR
ncbi:MAG TPA: PilZ domain-containing protein [Acidimicrobiales bacterium]|nr:PilZ domain-containing protein [Acidimicrobiales bacterium]